MAAPRHDKCVLARPKVGSVSSRHFVVSTQCIIVIVIHFVVVIDIEVMHHPAILWC
jgi:hypothetical protein